MPRSYTALVHGKPTAEIETAVKQRVLVDGKAVVPARARVRPGKEGRSILDVTLHEGRNRIVRNWCEAMGIKVDRLARISYGPVRLGDLPVGTTRLLFPEEEAALYAAIGLSPTGTELPKQSAAPRRSPARRAAATKPVPAPTAPGRKPSGARKPATRAARPTGRKRG